MSYGKAMAISGMASGRDQARQFRRQNEADERTEDLHGARMKALDLDQQMGQARLTSVNEGLSRDRLTYKKQQELLEAKRSFDAATMKFSVQGDPSGLIAAYNQHIPDGDAIVGYEMIEPKGEDESPQYRLKFASGSEQVFDRQTLGGLGSALSSPDMILQIEQARASQLAEQRTKAVDEENAHRRNLEEIAFEGQVERANAKHEQVLESGASGGGREVEQGDSNYFRNYLGPIYGGRFDGLSGQLLIEDSAKPDYMQATAIAEEAFRRGLGRADAAQVGYAAVSGVLSEEEAETAARAEWEALRKEADTPEKREALGEADQYIATHADRLIRESRWAADIADELQLSTRDRVTGGRGAAIDPGSAAAPPAGEPVVPAGEVSELLQFMVEP